MSAAGFDFLGAQINATGSDEPKHLQLSRAILAAIDGGHWPPGSKLPTEQELARHTPYSLGTVQRALRSLVNSGVIVRRQGAGSFVAASDAQTDDPWHLRFIGDDGVSFLPVRPKVVSRDRFAGPGNWMEHLNLDVSEEVVQVDRRIDVAGEFDVYSRFFAAADPYGALLYRPLGELDDINFKVLLRQELGVVITDISQDIRSTEFTQPICEALSLEEPTVGMCLQVVARTTSKQSIYYQELFVPPTQRRLHISNLGHMGDA